MSFMRPSVKRLLIHWFEVIIICLACLIFGYLTLQSIGRILPLIYGAITCVLLFLMFVAIRKARLPVGVNIKSGFVEVDERQITYFSLGQSWSISLDDLVLVKIEVTDKEDLSVYWIVSDIFGSVIRIPTSAKGNESLFDAILALKGVVFEQITLSMNSNKPGMFIIWKKI